MMNGFAVRRKPIFVFRLFICFYFIVDENAGAFALALSFISIRVI